MNKRLSTQDVKIAFRLLMRMAEKNIILRGQLQLLDDSIGIAMENGITIYDALYIALAKREGMPLLTLDKIQARIAERVGVSVVNLEDEGQWKVS